MSISEKGVTQSLGFSELANNRTVVSYMKERFYE